MDTSSTTHSETIQTHQSADFHQAQTSFYSANRKIVRNVTIIAIVTAMFIVGISVWIGATVESIRNTQVTNTRITNQKDNCQDHIFNLALNDVHKALLGDRKLGDFPPLPQCKDKLVK